MKLTGIVVAGALLVGCSGKSNDTGEAEQSTEAVAATTTATAPTITTALSATTTVAPTTSTTTTPTTTTLPPTTTTVVRTATVEDVMLVLPAVTELPPGWSSAGGFPDTQLNPQTGPVEGICGGDNAAARAIQNGVVAHAATSAITTSEGGAAGIAVYAFATPEAAGAFMAQREADASSCPGGVQADVSEGDGPGMYDGFGTDDSATRRAVWQLRSGYSLGGAVAVGADDAFFVRGDREYTTTLQGTNYGSREVTLTQFERHGAVVVTIYIFGSCCAYGYSNVETQTDYQPEVPQLSAFADHVRPTIVANLRTRSLVSA